MNSRLIRLLPLAIVAFVPGLVAQGPTQARYLTPPPEIVAAFDVEPLPAMILSPTRQVMALTRRKGEPSIAELARPVLRLAGARVNPKTFGPQRTGLIYAIDIKPIAGGADTKVTVPPGANLSDVKFSPDGAHLSFLNTKDDGIELWVADVATGAAKPVVSGGDRISAAAGDPCDWQSDSRTMVCTMVPEGRGPAPAEPEVPLGPNVQETSGKAAPAATYEDMIKTSHDEDLFEYYWTSQLTSIDTASGAKAAIGRPAIFASVAPSPSGAYLLVATVKRPYSHLMPMNGFPESIEIWDRKGTAVHKLTDRPSREGTPLTGVEPGPRGHHWRGDQPATVVWEEALDGGNLKNKVPFRDRVVALAAPFTAEPAEFAKTEWRFDAISFTEKGVALLRESDRSTRHVRTWILEPGAQPRQVWDRKQDSAYDDPGTPVARHDSDTGRGGGRGRPPAGPILQAGDYIYLTGAGSSPEGDRPFLDRLNVKTLQTERLFRSSGNALESVIAPLDDNANRFLTRYETPTEPPNYYTRNRDTSSKRAVTGITDPQPQFRGVERQFVTYKRNDGVALNGTLYLPPGYKKGEHVPLIMWAYPREFGDADSASQVTGSPNHFMLVNGYSHLFLLLSGYAILDNPTMPIVGPGETANDHYVEQLVASAQAAVDQVVAMGVTDRDHIGVGGHSYGAFMTANLLAHSRLFRAGFAESGAYNRSLTPFGFQSERRTFWEVPDLYARMSPFWYANQIKDPILLMHGEADDNSGTFPVQSERLYMALKGHGATVRYVTLPFEAHGYAARETLLHVLAERINWFDKYVKHAAPRTTTEQQQRN
ncbi:MAG TPA: prolyl oligopeptidase family serine peptidase [Vicinamibacterales bacterium]|jgi:dipeptidyl aminopeptidase/acylaminoacyl peptidase|nr:prolyl oligopeptidase family serine peptidase [Vicinamibacterales bacterium]